MVKQIKNWWKRHTEYQLTDIEQSLFDIISNTINESEIYTNIVRDPSTEIYTPAEGPYILKFNGGICRITDSCIKLYCKDKLVFHDITPGMGYKLRQVVRLEIDTVVSEIEDDLDKNIIDFIKSL